MLWRQGDVFIETAGGIPTGAIRKPEPVLAEGELSGHFHRAEDASAATVYEHRGLMFLEVSAEQTRIVHDEHGPITLPRGVYRVWRQREYDPQSLRFSPLAPRLDAWTFREATTPLGVRFVED